MNLPNARTADILEQEAGKELLIYDLRIDKAFSLNETSKNVFNACRRQMSFDEFKRASQYTDDLIHFALEDLKTNELIENYQGVHFAGMNRRAVIKQAGLVSVAALPVISAIFAPSAANAASGAPGGGGPGSGGPQPGGGPGSGGPQPG